MTNHCVFNILHVAVAVGVGVVVVIIITVIFSNANIIGKAIHQNPFQIRIFIASVCMCVSYNVYLH